LMRVEKREFEWELMRVEKREFAWELMRVEKRECLHESWWELRSESLHESFLNTLIPRSHENKSYMRHWDWILPRSENSHQNLNQLNVDESWYMSAWESMRIGAVSLIVHIPVIYIMLVFGLCFFLKIEYLYIYIL
jgi:hypothetical protein